MRISFPWTESYIRLGFKTVKAKGTQTAVKALFA
jgi:hypothetical protein